MSLLDRIKALFSPAAASDLTGRLAAAASSPTSSVPRLPLTDAEGLRLVDEIGFEGRRFPAELQAAAESFAAIASSERPTDPDELSVWGNAYVAARVRFWEALEGEVVDGVEIVRRR